jgi:hypothetical protein
MTAAHERGAGAGSGGRRSENFEATRPTAPIEICSIFLIGADSQVRADL